MTYYKEINTVLGKLTIVADDSSLKAILWEHSVNGIEGNNSIIQKAEKQLQEYFVNKRSSFDIPLAPMGTNFQMDVWKALREIPYGKTVSYADIAKKIGRPKAVRAVGTAIGKNPILVLIPCHRVIGSNGSLGGFSASLANKKLLLNVEAIDLTL